MTYFLRLYFHLSKVMSISIKTERIYLELIMQKKQLILKSVLRIKGSAGTSVIDTDLYIDAVFALKISSK